MYKVVRVKNWSKFEENKRRDWPEAIWDTRRRMYIDYFSKSIREKTFNGDENRVTSEIPIFAIWAIPR